MSVEFETDLQQSYASQRGQLAPVQKGSKLAAMLVSMGLAKDERAAGKIALVFAAVVFIAAIAVYMNMSSSGSKPVIRNGGRTPIPAGVQPLGMPQ